MSTKKEETRLRRLGILIASSKAGHNTNFAKEIVIFCRWLVFRKAVIEHVAIEGGFVRSEDIGRHGAPGLAMNDRFGKFLTTLAPATKVCSPPLVTVSSSGLFC